MDGPTPLKPEDDWVRGNALQLSRRIADTDPGDSELWQRLYLGDAAMRLMRGLADTTEAAKVMAHVIARCELEVQQGTRELLALSDVGSEEAKAIHFNIRVSSEIVSRINRLFADGVTAASEIENSNQGA